MIPFEFFSVHLHFAQHLDVPCENLVECYLKVSQHTLNKQHSNNFYTDNIFIKIDTVGYCRCFKNSNTSFFLFSNKMLVIRLEFTKCLSE